MQDVFIPNKKRKAVDYLNGLSIRSQKLYVKLADFRRSNKESKLPRKEIYHKQEREVNKKVPNDFKGTGKEVLKKFGVVGITPAGVGPSFVDVVHGVKH